MTRQTRTPRERATDAFDTVARQLDRQATRLARIEAEAKPLREAVDGLRARVLFLAADPLLDKSETDTKLAALRADGILPDVPELDLLDVVENDTGPDGQAAALAADLGLNLTGQVADPLPGRPNLGRPIRDEPQA